jgi:glycosyltransferase involved in cell wall biosynthesis
MRYAIEKYYRSADICVLPSLREGMPNALLEAMSCGLPVIVSRFEGDTDWIMEDGNNGFLFEPGNRFQMGETILNVLKDNQSSLIMGRAHGKPLLRDFQWRRLLKITSVYMKC